MKTIVSLLDGAIMVTEQAGVITLSFNESIGGGAAAGVIKGQGSVILNGTQALQMGEQLVAGLLPANLQPLALVVAGVVNQAVSAIE